MPRLRHHPAPARDAARRARRLPGVRRASATHRADPFTAPLALNLTALVMLGIGAFWTLLSVSTAGQFRDADLLTGPEQLRRFGLWELAMVVLFTTFVAPLARILCMISC